MTNTSTDNVVDSITQEWLTEAALIYLKSYETTVGHLRSVLERKIIRKNQGTSVEVEAFRLMVDEAITYCTERSYVDDERYVQLFMESARTKGMSRRKIDMKLRQKKVDPTEYADLIEDHPYDELGAAEAFARKKRIGAFRTGNQDQNRQKDMAKLARQGFGYDVCRKMVDGDLTDEED